MAAPLEEVTVLLLRFSLLCCFSFPERMSDEMILQTCVDLLETRQKRHGNNFLETTCRIQNTGSATEIQLCHDLSFFWVKPFKFDHGTALNQRFLRLSGSFSLCSQGVTSHFQIVVNSLHPYSVAPTKRLLLCILCNQFFNTAQGGPSTVQNEHKTQN